MIISSHLKEILFNNIQIECTSNKKTLISFLFSEKVGFDRIKEKGLIYYYPGTTFVICALLAKNIFAIKFHHDVESILGLGAITSLFFSYIRSIQETSDKTTTTTVPLISYPTNNQ